MYIKKYLGMVGFAGALFFNGCSATNNKTEQPKEISKVEKYSELNDYDVCKFVSNGKLCLSHLNGTTYVKAHVSYEKTEKPEDLYINRTTEYEDFNKDYVVDRVTVIENDVERKYDKVNFDKSTNIVNKDLYFINNEKGSELEKFQKDFEKYLDMLISMKKNPNIKLTI